MDSIWMGIAPGPKGTRVIAMQGAAETLLKACLSCNPAHPRALPTLLEGIALWQGMPVRAALVVGDKQTGYDLTLYREAWADFGNTPLYTLDWVPGGGRRPRRNRDLSGMGDFRDLRQVVLFEVAR